jgi:tRNA(Ile2) C34 agmatinyltransferase TiaS
MMNMTGDDIINLLRVNDKAVARALVVLKNRQTVDEQRAQVARHQNGRGFRPAHARMGTSMAEFYERNGYLSPKQIAYWRSEGKQGMRIAIYWRQLLEEANERKAA